MRTENAAYAAALRTRRGTPAVFPFLRINPFPFKARYARKGIVPLSLAAAPLLYHASKACCHTRMANHFHNIIIILSINPLTSLQQVQWYEVK